MKVGDYLSEIIYGKNTVVEYLKSGKNPQEIWVTKQVLSNEVIINSIVNNKDIVSHIVDRKVIDNIVQGNHQGVAVKIAAYDYYSIDNMLNDAKKQNEVPFLVILDGLEDTHNLGAILRTADSCGVHGIIIPKNRSVSLNATVAKMSAGAINYVKVAKVTNINNTIRQLKKLGIWIIGSDINTDIDYRKMDATVPVAIVIGSEGKGISRLVKENCDLLVKLPMKGQISSLNASVAASVILYEVFNQRCPL